MSPRILAAIGVCAAAVVLTACETSKSSNPLSPSVAGPIPGVEITAPKILEPVSGVKIAVDNQPIELLIENASSSGVRPLSYAFEIAADAAFATKVFTREGVAPGDGGRTKLRLPEALTTGRSYYWRARAEDGANTGPFSTASNFNVFTPIIIEPPVLMQPAQNSTVSSLRPQFVVNNSNRSGPVGALSYTIEIADSFAFTNRVATMTIGEQSGQTKFDLNTDLKFSTVYYWHVRAGDSTTTGPWSDVLAFATGSAPVIPDPIPPPPGGGGDAGDFAWSKVRIIGGSPDVRGWPITASITSLSIGGGVFHIDYTRRCGWPGVDIGGALQEATIWMFEKIGGQWYGTGAERLRPCQADKQLGRPSDIASGWFYNSNWAPMTGYVPARGETVGFMVTAGSTRADNNAPVHERTGVVLVPWPGDGGGSWPPFLWRE
jgi:hypothetical protein